MASVGLLYVGAVLFINGIMLLGWLDAKSAAPMNFFVGGLQVLTPTYIIFTANGNQDTILAASGLYLFGFTYLYVGINLTAGLDGTGLGYFSLFVAVCAVVFSYLNFTPAPRPCLRCHLAVLGLPLGTFLPASRAEDGRPGTIHRSCRRYRRLGHRSYPRLLAAHRQLGKARQCNRHRTGDIRGDRLRSAISRARPAQARHGGITFAAGSVHLTRHRVINQSALPQVGEKHYRSRRGTCQR